MLWKPSANFASCVHRRRFALSLIWLLKICDTLPTLDRGLNFHPNKLIVETDRNSEELQGDWEGRPRGRAWIIPGTQKTVFAFQNDFMTFVCWSAFYDFLQNGKGEKGNKLHFRCFRIFITCTERPVKKKTNSMFGSEENCTFCERSSQPNIWLFKMQLHDRRRGGYAVLFWGVVAASFKLSLQLKIPIKYCPPKIISKTKMFACKLRTMASAMKPGK